MTEPRSM